jgi:hypothetical protein
MSNEQYFSYTNSKGTTYYLNDKEQESKSGKVTHLYYFSKEPTDRTLGKNEFPKDREIKESGNGFPIVKKSE